MPTGPALVNEGNQRRLDARRESYDLSQLAGRLLYVHGLAAEKQKRTVWCHRVLKSETQRGHVWRRQDGSGARLTGVVTCGMVWTCAVCARRVAERRREELQLGIVRHVAAGGHVYLLTLTFPHELTLPLADAERLFSKALAKFKASKAYRKVRARFGHIGSVRSIELTWGTAHGWHLHSHDLFFAQPGLENDEASLDELRGAWVTALLKVKLAGPEKITWMMEHALDVRGGKAAADYVTAFGHDAHWGLSSEITRTHAKIGLRRFTELEGSVTPFQILAWAGQGDADARRLFLEYADAMEGARMLYWSPKLKAKLGITDDMDDADVAADERPRPEEKCVADFNGDELALVLSRNALGEMLQFVAMVEQDHEACLRDFFDVLRARPRAGPSNRGTIRRRIWRERREGAEMFSTLRLRADADELEYV